MKKQIFILILLSMVVLPQLSFAEDIPFIKEGSTNVEWSSNPPYDKYKSVYNYCYNTTSVQFNVVIDKAEINRWETASQQAGGYNNIKNSPAFKGFTPKLKVIILNAGPGGGANGSGWVYVYKNGVLLDTASATPLGGMTQDGGTLIQNIEIDGNNVYGDVYVYTRAGITSFPARLVGKKMLLNQMLFTVGAYSSTPGYGCTRGYFYYAPESGIKGEIKATKNDQSVRAVRPGEKVDIHWNATKN
jgi:hypothetical protein